MQPDETVTTLMKVKDYDSAEYLFFTTRLGRVKRTELSQFRSVRSSGLIAIGIDAEDGTSLGAHDHRRRRHHARQPGWPGSALREDAVRAMGRPAAGVIGIRLDPGDRVIASEAIVPELDLLVVEKGLGKRTATDHFITKGRGGKGVAAMKLTVRTGKIVGAGMVGDDHALMLIDLRRKGHPPASRADSHHWAANAEGVTLMKLDPDESVATMTIVEKKEEEIDPSLPALNGNGRSDSVPE